MRIVALYGPECYSKNVVSADARDRFANALVDWQNQLISLPVAMGAVVIEFTAHGAYGAQMSVILTTGKDCNGWSILY
jgi:hypothetical protein